MEPNPEAEVFVPRVGPNRRAKESQIIFSGTLQNKNLGMSRVTFKLL